MRLPRNSMWPFMLSSKTTPCCAEFPTKVEKATEVVEFRTAIAPPSSDSLPANVEFVTASDPLFGPTMIAPPRSTEKALVELPERFDAVITASLL